MYPNDLKAKFLEWVAAQLNKAASNVVDKVGQALGVLIVLRNGKNRLPVVTLALKSQIVKRRPNEILGG